MIRQRLSVWVEHLASGHRGPARLGWTPSWSIIPGTREGRFGARPAGLLAVGLWIGLAGAGLAQTNFTVTSPNYIYAVNGVLTTNAPGFNVNNCPLLTLVAGNTYVFTMQASLFHPMVVVTQTTGVPPATFAYSNASPQDIYTGAITLSIPRTNYPTTLYYECNVHGFYGVINIIPPPSPDRIVSLSVTTNIVLVSTGTSNAFTLVPQFSSNVVNGAWQAVPSYTNTFAGGTNTTVFDRLDPICGPNVFLRISQQPPTPL